ncbi:unnamed protein product, partial [Ectocarpus sp. 8 AP-2014]
RCFEPRGAGERASCGTERCGNLLPSFGSEGLSADGWCGASNLVTSAGGVCHETDTAGTLWAIEEWVAVARWWCGASNPRALFFAPARGRSILTNLCSHRM